MAETDHALSIISELDDKVERHIRNCRHKSHENDWDEIYFYRRSVFIEGVAWEIDFNTFNPIIDYSVCCTWINCRWKLNAEIKIVSMDSVLVGEEE